MFRTLLDEIDGIMARDPAARSRLDVAISYSSFHAMLFHRLSNWLWRRKMRLIGRWVSQWGRFWTGIEIHPAAAIGKRLFIDHGMGVVIGETAEIGDDVTLYHDVTLGGTSPSVESSAQRNVKRHPTLQDGVIVGSGAQILGPITVGSNARVGANAVVLRDVSPNVTVTGVPAKTLMPKNKRMMKQFVAYGATGDLVNDPVVPAIEALRQQVQALTERIEQLETEKTAEAEVEAPEAKSA